MTGNGRATGVKGNEANSIQAHRDSWVKTDKSDYAAVAAQSERPPFNASYNLTRHKHVCLSGCLCLIQPPGLLKEEFEHKNFFFFKFLIFSLFKGPVRNIQRDPSTPTVYE